jgi:hypothetical protein
VLRRLAPDRAVLALAALVLGSTLVRFALSHGVAAPWIAPDEQLYGLLGRSLVDGHGLRVLGESVPYYSALYPLLVGLPFIWSDVAGGVRGVQALQALVMSATAIPVFLWARPVAGPRWALVAAGLTVLIPGLVYSGLFMSEALYYPAATLAAWALAACLRKPTLLRQALLLAAIGVALATRLQAIGFAGVIFVAVAFLAVAERSSAPLRRMLPTLALLTIGAIAWIGSRVVLGGTGQLLGGYATLGQARAYSVTDIAQSIAWQAGALTLVTVGIPLLALGVLAWETLRGRDADADVRAVVAAGVAYVTVTVLEVSAFASRFVEHVTERQLLSVIPPAFVAFAVWLRRGAPRPQPVTYVLTFLLAASALLLPLDRVTTPAAFADAPSLIPLERLSHHLSKSAFETAYAVGAGLVLLLGALLPRRLAPVLAVVVALALASGSFAASREVRDRSQVERERTFAGVAPDWIDASGADDVTLLLTGQRFWPSAWEALFWNSSIEKVIRLPGVDNPGAVPQEVASARPDGRFVTRSGKLADATYVAAPTGITIVGEPVATLPASFYEAGMTLWRVTPPLRVSARVGGLRPNGDLNGGEHAVVRVFGCGRGQLELTLLGKQGLETRILRNGTVRAAQRIPPGGVWRPKVPAPPSANGRRTCVYRIESDGLMGSTRIDFVRR